MDNHIWCVAVWGSDNYAPGAMVVAQTVREVGSKYPIWCMIGDGVSESTEEKLRLQFDNVVKVPVLTHKCIPMKSKKQNEIYGSWIHTSFTKCQILNPEYFPGISKVILIDADMMFLENCDELFELSTPAMTFSSPWAYPYVINNGRKLGGKNFYIKNGKEPVHGQIIPKGLIRKSFSGAILGLACMVLVSPDTTTYAKMLSLLNRNIAYGYTNCISGFDEQLFAETFLETAENVYHIHQQYNWIVGKHNWLFDEKPKTQQFYNGKPWHGITCADDVELSEWDDVRAWWIVANRVLEQYPQWSELFYSKK